MVDVSVVVPAYRERRLRENVRELSDALADLDHEIIVVTDHPQDPTTGEAADLSVKEDVVVHVSLQEPRGKGGAVLEGFRRAQGDVVGFVDADNAVPPSGVRRLVEEARKSEGAIASRNAPGSDVVKDRSLSRRVASRAFNWYVRLVFSMRYRDTQCGAKFFAREPLSDVVPDMVSTGFEFDVELLWRMERRGIEVDEVPVEWVHDDESGFSLREGPSMLLNLLRIRALERN